jgi:hypothetical protein
MLKVNAVTLLIPPLVWYFKSNYVDWLGLLCEKHLHLHLKGVCIASLYLGKDSPMDPKLH